MSLLQTFHHFVNCALLTYAPFFVLEKGSTLSTESRFPSYAIIIAGYLFTQVVKMIVSATFLPSAVEGGSGAFSLVQEVGGLFLGTAAGPAVADLVAIVYLLRHKAIRAAHEWPVVAVAFAWALAEAVATRLLPLWFNARGSDFTWEWTLTALEANVQLVKVLACTAAASVCFVSKQKAPGHMLWLLILLLVTPVADSYLASTDLPSLQRVAGVSAVILFLSAVVYKTQPEASR